MSEYPVPSYAAHIWAKGDTIMVGFPPVRGFTQGHSVAYPATPKGMELLITNLRARGANSSIGQIGEPTQYQTERALAKDRKYSEWLKAMSVNKAKQDEAEAFLKDIGLI